MNLTKNQQEAYDTFKKTGYVCVNAPRRSGKTTLLHKIIEEHKGKVGVFTMNYQMFKNLYKDKFGSKVIFRDESQKLLIGDEVMIEKADGKEVACAGTFLINTWKLKDSMFLKDIKKMKKRNVKGCLL